MFYYVNIMIDGLFAGCFVNVLQGTEFIAELLIGLVLNVFELTASKRKPCCAASAFIALASLGISQGICREMAPPLLLSECSKPNVFDLFFERARFAATRKTTEAGSAGAIMPSWE